MKANSSWLKRTLAMLLVVVTLIGLIPTSVIAAAAESLRSSSYIPGDVNGDGDVNALDVNLLRRYIVGGYDVTINLLAADVNADGDINAQDVNNIRRHIAGGYNIELKPGLVPTYSVKFYDGDRLIDTLTAEKDQPLGAVPAVEKSSKANAILLGYFTDPECTQPFYAENPVTGDMNVYAKYEEMGSTEELNFTSFAQMDQTPDLSFEVVGTGDPSQAITLEVKDGSDPVELKFEATNDGYIVSAVGSFNEGCSYQLHLADGWTFKDKPETIRTATFSIAMEQVENLKMSDDIVYILDTDAIDYIVGGNTYDMLTTELITEQGGSFTYTGAALKADDLLCIYTGTHPEERGFDGDMLDPAYYVKVNAVNGSAITFTALGEDDFLRLYNIPDNFPLKVDALPTATTGTINISSLDKEVYVLMQGEGYDLEKAKTLIEVGDFISIYVSWDDIATDDDIYFGEITAYNAQTGEITYKKTTKQAILDSMDLYRDIEISGEDLVTEEEAEEIEATILSQIQESGFAEDAAFMLADMVSKTDGFENASLQSLLITDSQGNPLSDDEIQLLNLGKAFELTDDVKLTVELIREGDQLHYKKGTQIAVGVEASFEVELEDDEKIAIELNATFVQEVAVSPKVKGYVVPYFIGLIPLPVGANLNGTVDIKSFTAFSFEATIYTVAPEDESLWDQLKDVMKNPEKLAELDGLPTELAEGLKTTGDVLDKIKEMKDELSKMKDTAEDALGTAEAYAEDIALLWGSIEYAITEEEYSEICEALDQTNVTQDLLDMMELTDETGLQTEYYESIEALMERYCEMVEKETDWVTLLEKDVFDFETCVYGVAIGVDIDFLVRADLSLAIGSNLQYETGKRYEFYFKFAPGWKKAGCETMDLLDERFAFQFYVMGRLGLKAGIKAKLECGIGSCIAANAGVSVELGPYFKLWGFFIYEHEKYRAANTKEWYSDERMAGALVMEFGAYFKLAFEAEAIGGMFSYEYEFLDKEVPILTIGDDRFYYQPDYEPAEDEMVTVKDVDNNSSNGITMTLPEYTIALDYVDLKKGRMAIESLDYDHYIYTVSNPNFSIDRETGLITVNVPDGTRYMECDLTVTYKYSKMAFSTYDMSVTVPLVWTNMTDAELSEYYTASVRVGNDTDGYTTVWSKRVLKNSEFDLPTVEEIQKLIGWNEYKYDMGTGYGSQQIEDLTLIENEVYDFNIDYDTYTITVTGVENGTGSATFYASYGEAFDFSALEATGTTDYVNGVFTKFGGLTAPEGIDLSKAIDTRMAAALANGVTATANYVDNSVTATFVFNGIDAEEVTIKLRRGDIPDLSAIEAIVAQYGMAIKEITPVIAPVTFSVLYQVICGELNTPPATITFVENGGSEVEDITKPYGSLIGTLPTPNKTGHTFGGWYTDEALTQLFTETKLPEGGLTLYAKWTANEYTVSFNENGGDELADDKITVTYGKAYGELPKAQRTGYGFIGWFTAAQGGTQITAQSIYAIDGNQTLYAQWRELKEISADVFDFGQQESYTYRRNTSRNPGFMFSPVSGESYTFDDFTFSYIAEGYENEGYVSEVINSGTWGVKVTRPADDYYAKFEAFYPGVLVIEKIERDFEKLSFCSGRYMNLHPDETANGYTYLSLNIIPYNWDWENLSYDYMYDCDNSYGYVSLDADDSTRIVLSAYPYGTTPNTGTLISSSAPSKVFDDIKIYDLEPGVLYEIYLTILEDRNYNEYTGPVIDVLKVIGIFSSQTLRDQYGYWEDHTDTTWYNDTDTEFTLYTAEQLAGLAELVDNGNNFAGKTVKLGADIDLGGYQWEPIGDYGGDGAYMSEYSFGNPFSGIFDGQNHTISGMYINQEWERGMGLFGYVAAAVIPEKQSVGTFGVRWVLKGESCIVQNVVLDNSFVRGYYKTGGIAGVASIHYLARAAFGENTHGDGYMTIIRNCTNNAVVVAASDNTAAGGIVGHVFNDFVGILNNVNYGAVRGSGARFGGIAGYVGGGKVFNNVNFGNVSGDSRVGGIVGTCEDESDLGGTPLIYNNYNYGIVRGTTNEYIGAVVGRNVKDKSTVQYNYYLQNCAKGKDGKVRNALGTETGSVAFADKEGKNYYASYFASLESTMTEYAGTYATLDLITALNQWITDNSEVAYVNAWVSNGPNGYPIPEGTVIPELRK